MKKSLLLLLFASLLVQSHAQVKTETRLNAAKPFVLGVIEEFFSKELGENRVLNIYLPEGYNSNDTTRYEVVYLLDGSADEDFIHVAGLYQFNNFDWVKRTPKSIVVGIATVDRKRDFTFPTNIAEDKKAQPTSGGSAKFISFIEKDLQPFIEKKYKTNQSRTLIGQSLGGLLATQILINKPRLFNKYIIISPSLWWDNGSLLSQKTQLAAPAFSQPTQVYIGVGKEGFTPTKIPRVMEVDANILADKIRSENNKNVKVYYDYLPDENHATIMHHALFNALNLIK